MRSDLRYVKGQIMLEMLIIVSFLLLILIPTVIYILSVLSTESWKTDSNQAYSTLTKIVSVSNKLSMLGNGSSSTETMFLPSSVQRLNTSSDGREIYIVLNGPKSMRMEVVVPSNVPIQLNSSHDWSNVRGAQSFIFLVQNGVVIISKLY
ncbi:MAG: hypothetical protein N3G74_02015 [Candidatus Micrarchaeota archaeon]|nr:hypothetical protein [Candidatus Micrarchaeota archaeon]